MYITNHMILSKDEKRKIVAEKNSSISISELDTSEALFLTQDDERIIAFVLINKLSTISSSLWYVYIEKAYMNLRILGRLFEYVVWELKNKGKQYLEIRIDGIEHQKKLKILLRLLLGNRYRENVIIKVDGLYNRKYKVLV